MASGIPINSIVITPRKWIILIPFIVPLLVFLVLGQQNDRSSQLVFLSIAAGIFIVVMIIFRKRRIEIDNEGLTIRSIVGDKYIQWYNVSAVFTTYERQGKSRTLHFNFTSRNGRTEKFSVALYSRSSLRTLAEAIITKCLHADIEPRIRNMANGQFPWYIF